MMDECGLRLRPIEREDLVFLSALTNDPVVRGNVVGWDWPRSHAAEVRWFEQGSDNSTTRRFIIESPTDGPVGVTGLWEIDWRNRNASIGVKIGGREDVRNKGMGKLALKAITAFAFDDVALHRVHAQILEFNVPSMRLFEGAGWSREGMLREHVWRHGRWWGAFQYGLLQQEYLALTAASRALDLNAPDDEPS